MNIHSTLIPDNQPLQLVEPGKVAFDPHFVHTHLCLPSFSLQAHVSGNAYATVYPFLIERLLP